MMYISLIRQVKDMREKSTNYRARVNRFEF